jgi:ketosteroid isomerase-like protein
MSSPEENVDLVRRGLEAFERNDPKMLGEFLDPEVEVVTSQGLINPGTEHGHEGFHRWSADWMDAWQSFENELVRVEPVGEHHVVAEMHQRGTGKGSGVKVENVNGFVFEERNGRAVSIHLYNSFDEALEVARDREAAGDGA